MKTLAYLISLADADNYWGLKAQAILGTHWRRNQWRVGDAANLADLTGEQRHAIDELVAEKKRFELERTRLLEISDLGGVWLLKDISWLSSLAPVVIYGSLTVAVAYAPLYFLGKQYSRDIQYFDSAPLVISPDQLLSDTNSEQDLDTRDSPPPPAVAPPGPPRLLGFE